MSIGGSKGKERTRSRVDIPDFLRPLVGDASNAARNALWGLEWDLRNPQDRVAGFDPLERLAQNSAEARAGSTFFQLPQQIYSQTARGQDISEYLDPSATRALQGASRGIGLSEFLPPEAIATLRRGAEGMGVGGRDVLRRGAEGMSVPGMSELRGQQGGQMPWQTRSTLSQFSRNSSLPPEVMEMLQRSGSQGELRGMDQLEGLLGQQGVPEEALNTLRATAGGDFLYGGDGFQAAVDAAVRAAQPQILSTFGRRATGGLAETAIAQAGMDAFASQYGQERQNQLSAAGQLGEFGLAERGQTGDLASRLSELDLSGRGQDADIAALMGQLGLQAGNQRIGAAQALGDADIANRGLNANISQALAALGLDRNQQRLSSAGALADIDLARNNQRLQSAESLAGFGDRERSRSLDSASLLASLGMQERGNQLDAARMLPEIGMADVNMLNSVGQTRRQMEQRLLDSEVDAELQLLAAALGIMSPADYLGGNQNTRARRFGFEGFV